MSTPIAAISSPRAIQPIAMPAVPGGTAPASSGFHQVLASALSQVSKSYAASDSAVANYLAGGNQELHSTILATQNAAINFELLLQVRNKVVAAYDEIMKMQI